MAARLWLIAGAEGVGKTTYAFRHIRAVSGTSEFVNLDELARGISPLNVERGGIRASRMAVRLIEDLIAEPRSFSLETTLAGRTHLRTIDAARESGVEVVIHYFAVRDVETCLGRIARRVAEGGHDVPEAEARRRFGRSLANFPLYAQKADLWRVFDANARPRIVAEGRRGCIATADDLSGLPEPLAAHLAALPPCAE